MKGKGIHSRWFFVTSQRVGRDLFLQTESGQPLSREKLEASVAGQGQVYRNAQDYRAAVDQALFQLGDRYHSLIDLLIQLRQPQLSRKLDEERLSEALSEALPPLSSHLIDDVAESFRSLEADRVELDNYAAAQQGVASFLKEYSRYVQIAARRRGEQVRKTHSGYESTMRKLREAEREASEARAALDQASVQLEDLRVSLSAARAAEQTLRDSPQMKDAQSLDEAGMRAREKEHEFTSRTDAHAQAVKNLSGAERDLKEQKAQWEAASEKAGERNARALESARQCRLELVHQNTLASPTAFQDPEARESAKRKLNAVCDQRQNALEHLDRLNQQLHVADEELARAEERFQNAESQLGRVRASEREARETLAREIEAFLGRYADWAGSVTLLQPMDSETFAVAYQDWLDSRPGKNPLLTVVDDARRAASDLLVEERNKIRNNLEETQDRRRVLIEERDQLETGEHAAPPPPHTRDTAGRQNRPGAPLWKLCDFSPSLDPSQCAGLEAALESSGLLDAWITPAGELLAPDTQDHIIIPDFDPSNAPSLSLANVLVPGVDATDPQASRVNEATLQRIFASIGLGRGAGTHWVGFDGQWQLGPLRGAWNKAEPEHIGHAAREALRQRRLHTLAEQIAELDATVRGLESRLSETQTRQQRVEREYQDAPTDQPVLESSSHLSLIGRQATQAQQRLEESEGARARSRAARDEALRKRDADAADLGLEAWRDRLRELERRLGEYRAELAALWPTIDILIQASRYHTAAAERMRQMASAESASAQAVQQARRESESAHARCRTLHASVGVAVEEILKQLETTIRRIETLDGELSAIAARKETLAVREGVAKKEIETTKAELDQAAQQRKAAINDLHLFAEHRLLQEAHAELSEIQPDDWSVSRAVEISRQVEVLLKSIATDEEAWKRNQRDIHHHITTL